MKISLFRVLPLLLAVSMIFTAGAAAPFNNVDIDERLALAPEADARVYVAHFAPFANTLDGTSVTVRVNGSDALTDFKFGDVTAPLDFAPGSYNIEILPTGTTTVAISGTVNLSADTDYVLSAIGNGSLQPLELFPLVNDMTPDAANAKLRIAHLAPFDADINNTQVDICTDDGSVVAGLAGVPYKVFTDPYLSLPPGDYDLKITQAGSGCATTYLDLPSLRLAKGDIADVFAIGDIANQPLAYATASGLNPTPKPMVKVAHFASFANTVDGTSVTVRVDGQDALTDVKFGAITDYIEFEPGMRLIEILPTGTTTVAISGTVDLAYDTKYTAAAIGNGSLQPLELFPLVDDMTPDASNAKLRVGHLAPFDADINNTKVDICTDDGTIVTGLADVPYKGYTDPYLSLPAGDYDLKITQAGSSCATTYLDLPSIRLAEGDITDLFAIGDIANLPLAYASATGLNPTPSPMVKVAHFASFADTVDGTSVTLRVDGQDALTEFKFGDITDYIELKAGENLVEILPTGTSTVAISATLDLAYDTKYTASAIGDGNNQPLEIFAQVDDSMAPMMPQADDGKLRVSHFAPFAKDINDTKVDICTDDGTVVSGLAGVPYKGYTDPYLTLPAGMYDLKITAADSNCATTLLDMDPILIKAGEIGSVFAIGDGTNLPVQTTTDPDLSPYMAYLPLIVKQTPAKVNVAHFASFANTVDGTSVTVRVDGQDALTEFKFGSMTDYLDFTPGEHTIEILPTGSSTVAISGTVDLASGTYYTLSAIGNGSLQPLELFPLMDDMTAPASGAKLRVGHLAPFDANIDNTKVDICTDSGTVVTGLAGVPYKGVTDPYLELPAGDYDLKITAAGSNCNTTYLDLDPLTLADGNIASVFAIGDITNLPLQIAVSAK
jgi:CYTH domain-containing protein